MCFCSGRVPQDINVGGQTTKQPGILTKIMRWIYRSNSAQVDTGNVEVCATTNYEKSKKSDEEEKLLDSDSRRVDPDSDSEPSSNETMYHYTSERNINKPIMRRRKKYKKKVRDKYKHTKIVSYHPIHILPSSNQNCENTLIELRTSFIEHHPEHVKKLDELISSIIGRDSNVPADIITHPCSHYNNDTDSERDITRHSGSISHMYNSQYIGVIVDNADKDVNKNTIQQGGNADHNDEKLLISSNTQSQEDSPNDNTPIKIHKTLSSTSVNTQCSISSLGPIIYSDDDNDIRSLINDMSLCYDMDNINKSTADIFETNSSVSSNVSPNNIQHQSQIPYTIGVGDDDYVCL